MKLKCEVKSECRRCVCVCVQACICRCVEAWSGVYCLYNLRSHYYLIYWLYNDNVCASLTQQHIHISCILHNWVMAINFTYLTYQIDVIGVRNFYSREVFYLSKR